MEKLREKAREVVDVIAMEELRKGGNIADVFSQLDSLVYYANNLDLPRDLISEEGLLLLDELETKSSLVPCIGTIVENPQLNMSPVQNLPNVSTSGSIEIPLYSSGAWNSSESNDKRSRSQELSRSQITNQSRSYPPTYNEIMQEYGPDTFNL